MPHSPPDALNTANTDGTSRSTDVPGEGRWVYAGAVAAITVVVVTALSVILVLWFSESTARIRHEELFKASLTVLGAGVLGGLIAYAFGSVQHERDRRQENARREVVGLLDERHRLDTQMTAFLERTLKHYHAVKRVRRELEAITMDEAGGIIKVDEYDRYARRLIRHQLAFERLQRIAPPLDQQIQAILGLDSDLASVYGQIQSFLNEVLEEYQSCRNQVAEAGAMRITDLADRSRAMALRKHPDRYDGRQPATLQEFLYETSGFREDVTGPFEAAVAQLETCLLTPVQLPYRLPRVGPSPRRPDQRSTSRGTVPKTSPAETPH